MVGFSGNLECCSGRRYKDTFHSGLLNWSGVRFARKPKPQA